MRNRMCYW